MIGSTGLLGQALETHAQMRGLPCEGAARSGARHSVDVTDSTQLKDLVSRLEPSIVINCAAVTNLEVCERRNALAYAVNARAVALLAGLSVELDLAFVHVSTDHFFTGDGPAVHDELAKVRLVNEYARTKYAGEAFALTSPRALVVRTNIVGRRGWPARPTFAEWALDSLENDHPIVLYEDFFTSSIHSGALARAILDLVDGGARGLLNVASSQVSSKRAFVEALAEEAGIKANLCRGSVRELTPVRADSLGLDVSRAEQLLGRRLPDLRETVRAVLAEHRGTALAGEQDPLPVAATVSAHVPITASTSSRVQGGQ
ncbi:MAG TPA: sugar nucleotide-binding protein [Solirubrobacteraceae bacterium]|nr:sugar nucleotide-binding protein [Solirubrobacteraceae bacterium]